MIVGTPDEIANAMVDRFDQRAADGFNVLPATVPCELKDFVELVIPELRKRGKFRSTYSGQTLRRISDSSGHLIGSRKAVDDRN